MSASGKSSGKGGSQGSYQSGSGLGSGSQKVRLPVEPDLPISAPGFPERQPYNAADDVYGPQRPGGRLIVRQPQPGYFNRYPAQFNNYAPPPRRPEPPPPPDPVIPNPPVPPNPWDNPWNGNPGFDWMNRFGGSPIGPGDIFGSGGFSPYGGGIRRPTNPDDLWTGNRRAPILDRVARVPTRSTRFTPYRPRTRSVGLPRGLMY